MSSIPRHSRSFFVLSIFSWSVLCISSVDTILRSGGWHSAAIAELTGTAALVLLSYWVDRQYTAIVYALSGAFLSAVIGVAQMWAGVYGSPHELHLTGTMGLTALAMVAWTAATHPSGKVHASGAHESSGVYRITCRVNGKEYIGQTSQTFDDRWLSHKKKFRSQSHHNKWMQADWDRYGEGAFTFEVLEIVVDPTLLLARERWWQDKNYSAARRYNPPNITRAV